MSDFRSFFNTAEAEQEDQQVGCGLQPNFHPASQILQRPVQQLVNFILLALESDAADELPEGVVVAVPQLVEHLLGEDHLPSCLDPRRASLPLGIGTDSLHPLLADFRTLPEGQLVVLHVVLYELGLRIAKLAHPVRLALEVGAVDECLVGAALLADGAPAAFALVLPNEELELFGTDLATISLSAADRELELLEGLVVLLAHEKNHWRSGG